jgi:hypothetical protein
LAKADSNDKNSVDIKQTKGHILRAMDVIPGASKSNSQITAQEHKKTEQAPDIPKFDLADEIMAKHREITAIKRKAPGKKIEAHGRRCEVDSIGYVAELSKSALYEQEQIIADIVARDIEKLCNAYITNSSGRRPCRSPD